MIYYTNQLDNSFTINDILAFYAIKVPLVVVYETGSEIPQQIADKATFVQLKTRFSSFSATFFLRHFIEFVSFLFSIPFGDLKKIIRLNGLIEVLINFQNALIKVESLTPTELKCIKEEKILLSFWFYDILFPIVLRNKGLIKTILARSHRGDTYEGSLGVRELWLRDFQLSHIDKLHPISEDGAKFIRNLYPTHQNKVSCLHLGSLKYFRTHHVNSPSKRKIFVSCSWLNNKKNVHQIPELLSHLNCDFHWYHFGTGTIEWEQKVHIAIYECGLTEKCTLMGSTPNQEIQTFYSENSIDAFISLSSTEGVPVSFMEAMSYGIPVFATNVGGNGEIVNEATGKLVKLGTPVKEMADRLTELILEENETKKAARVRFWENHFNILINNKSLLN